MTFACPRRDEKEVGVMPDRHESDEQIVRGLVKSGQLQFINGGWSMHDEACTHYVSMIENTAFGHRFLKEELDYLPTVGWQIDPFGHSAVQVVALIDLSAFAPRSKRTQSSVPLYAPI